jgi:glutamate-1-semialdehyde 2,1-aminomutase
MDELLTISGHPAWSFLNFRDQGGYSLYEIKTLFLQEVFARGILTLGTHNISYAHSGADIDRLLAVYDEVFPLLKSAVSERRLAQLLRCKPLEPLFKLR